MLYEVITLHALESSVSVPEIILEETHVSINFLEMQIQRLKEHALTLIGSEETLQRSLEIITSIKGIAETSAIQLLGELLILPKDMNHRQWVAFAGLDPRHYQSGTSICKRPRISRITSYNVCYTKLLRVRLCPAKPALMS